MVPKLIHQIWKTQEIPATVAGYVATLKKLHPDWNYKLWTDLEADNFIKKHYAEHHSLYTSFKYNILRADFLRYCLIEHFGGFYVDLDFEFYKPLDSYLEKSKSAYFFKEPETKRNAFSTDLVCNFLFGANKNNNILKNTVKQIKSKLFLKIEKLDENKMNKNFLVLYSTGPILLTKVFKSVNANDCFLGDPTLTEGHKHSLGKHWYTGFWLNHEN